VLRALPLGLLLLAGAARAQEPEPAEHAASAEHGAEGEHHGIDPKTLAFQLANFGILVVLLVKLAGKPVNRMLKARHEQLKSDLDDAAKLRAAAEARYKEQEGRLANLEGEIARMRDAAVKEAEQEKARIVAGAEEKARRIQDETKFQLDQLVKETQLRLRDEVARAAGQVADQLLRGQVGPADEQRLAQTFVAELGTRAAGHGERTPPPAPAREEVTS
jgi:F-type H+-transporting ATPase subunit b